MNLDTNTEKGEEVKIFARTVLARLSAQYPRLLFNQTSERMPARLDLLVTTRSGYPTAVAELKCRSDPLSQFVEWNSVILTDSKREAMMAVSPALWVPGYVVLYSIPDDAIRVSVVTNRTGDLCYHSPTRWSETQATVNGGRVRRFNAYLPWERFYELTPEDFSSELVVKQDKLSRVYRGDDPAPFGQSEK